MIIDAHLHMWNRKMLPDMAVVNYLEPIAKAEGIYKEVFNLKLENEMPFDDYDVKIEEPIHCLDANNIDYAVVLATDFELVGGNRMTNEEYMEWLFGRCSVDDRFIPFIAVDPNRQNACEMIEKFVKNYNPKGIKMYPATGFYPDDEKMDKYWNTVDDFGLVVTAHAGMALPPLDEKYCHPKFFARVAENHPNMKIIIAHLGGKFHDEIFPLMEGHDNVYTDCSALQGWFFEDISMISKRLASVAGRFPDRVVFGTDFPLYEEGVSTTQFIRAINEGNWGTEKMKKDLLGDNMAKVLGL